jgi:hypothetical protein
MLECTYLMHAEATLAGFKAAAVATVASAVPTVSVVHLFEHRDSIRLYVSM